MITQTITLPPSAAMRVWRRHTHERLHRLEFGARRGFGSVKVGTHRQHAMEDFGVPVKTGEWWHRIFAASRDRQLDMVDPDHRHKIKSVPPAPLHRWRAGR
ncbi:MAG: hypothetical protein R3D99_11775 [Altererythrobacter sp.]